MTSGEEDSIRFPKLGTDGGKRSFTLSFFRSLNCNINPNLPVVDEPMLNTNTAAMLYPLTFTPLFKDKIWGGHKIKSILGKEFPTGPDGPLPNCGETWEISGVPGNISVVKEGALVGETLQAVLAKFGPELVGKHVYERYGNEFPLLVKFIDANDDLSIQVHPNDELARKRHNSFGKTEMWYIMQADPGAKLNSGFNREVTKEEYVKAVADNTITDILNIEEAKPGDVFFLPAGRVHYIGKGLLLAEIQQTSDVTYRCHRLYLPR